MRIYLYIFVSIFVRMYVCIFVQCICIWIEHLESRALTLLTLVICDEWEVGRSGLEEEGTVFLINIIVNHDFFKVMDMNQFNNKLSFLSPRICGMVSVYFYFSCLCFTIST